MIKLKSWDELKAISDCIAIEQVKKAGKHKCKPVVYGTIKRLQRKDGKLLKRPVIIGRFYHCAKCYRIMQPMKTTSKKDQP